jgi:hypothetical protein
MSTADRALSKALRRLEGSNFELDPQEIARTSTTHAVVPIMWLVTVLEALGAFVDSEGWMK